ncbi:MAG: hypothetical protein J7M32_01135, partial [Deltaproteobacteria bacterium]|nr:hypothetical protein [Deltaproteobacteria bacterium]
SAIADPRDESLGKNAQLGLAGGCPPQISHSRDRPGGPERKKNPPVPGVHSLLSPRIIKLLPCCLL